MQANLSELDLHGILSLATAGKKTACLTLCRGDETVQVFFNDGNIVHATCPIGAGEKAIYYPITWDEGIFTLQADDTAPATTIRKSPERILDAVRTMRREWEAVRAISAAPECVFQLSEPSETGAGPITILHAAWQVLRRVDGRHTVQEIAADLEAPFATTAKTLFNLHEAGLVAVVTTETGKTVSTELLTTLVESLTEVMGPMAPFVVRDQIRSLGESQDRFPQAKLEDLIALVSQEITSGKLRNEFQAVISKARFRLLLQESSEINMS